MHIGFDAKRLFTNFTGLGNYSRRLVHQYHTAYPADQLHLFTPRLTDDPRTQSFISDAAYYITRPKGWKPFWRSFGLTDEIHHSGVQVYHGLSHELPVGLSRLRIGKVVTIHDLIFKYYPDDNRWFDRRIYDWKWKHACMMADVIIAISEQTQKDIVDIYGIRPEKIEVIYQGADPIFSSIASPDEIQKVHHQYQLPDTYNLYVGSVISRKNLLTIIRAMAIQPVSERVPLVIIGQGGAYAEKVKKVANQLGLTSFLCWLGSPAFTDFPAIYKRAQMMIYPSFHEGFGLPVLEAMEVGIPVITSNQSSLKEAGGDSAYLISPSLPEELAYAMSQIQADPGLQASMIQKGHAHVHSLQKRSGMDQYRAIYQAVCP